MTRRTATGPNGEKLELQDGKWVPISTSSGFVGPVDEMTGPLPSLGRNPEEQSQNLRQGMRQGFGSFIANALSIPHATGKLLAAGGAVPALVPGGESFTDARLRGEKQFPASAFLSIPDVSTEEVLAAPTAVGRAFSNVNDNAKRARQLFSNPNSVTSPIKSPSVPENFDAAVAEEEGVAAANPIATSAGRTAGDVASMMALRPGQRLMDKFTRLNPRASLDNPKNALDAAARSLQRGMGRTAEAGFDGAVMGALGDADPGKTAAWSAGIQAGGSAAMAAKNAFFRKPLSTFATLFLGHEMFKAIAPGPQDFFESKDAAVNEMVTAYGLGLAARLAGAGRDPGRIIGAMEHASRSGLASVVTQLQEAQANNQPQYARVLDLLSQDQERFGTDVRVRLERAARSEEPRALLNEIDALMQSTRFRKALEDAEAPAEQPKQSFGDWLMRR
jgi:hypothetical protein